MTAALHITPEHRETSIGAVLLMLTHAYPSWVDWSSLRIAGVRYGARIGELQAQGYRIASEPLESGTGKRYRLLSLEPNTTTPTHRARLDVTLAEAEELLAGGAGLLMRSRLIEARNKLRKRVTS